MASGFVRKDPFDVTPYKILKGVEAEESRRADALAVRQDAERARDDALSKVDDAQQATALLKDQQAAVKQREKQLQLLRDKAKAAKAHLKASQAELRAAEAAYVQADTQFDRITAALHRGRVDVEAAAAETGRQQAALRDLAQRRAATESKAARRSDRQQHAQAQSVLASTSAVEHETQRRLAAAEAERRRLAGSSAAQEQAATAQYVNEQADSMQQTAQERRLAAIVSLKHNTEAAHAALAAQREAAHAHAQEKEEAHAQRFDALLSAGQNPYLVFREEAMQAQYKRTVREHTSAVAARQLQVAEAVTADDIRQRRRAAAAGGAGGDGSHLQRTAAAQQHEDAAAATSSFLQARTRGGGDVIDESGRGRAWEPSQVVAVKTPAFGTGTMHAKDPQLLQRIASRPENRAVQPEARWVPPVARHPDEGEQGGETHSAGGGVSPRQDSYSSVAARRILQQRALSRLEARLMEEAKQRQRAGITQQQVVMGKTFKGAGFVPSPSILHFKDFHVGTPMRLVLTLTNASLSFNAFRLQPLADDVVDFFDITYTRPGRMSAGTSCKIAIKFTPRVDKDIFASLDILAQTGRISVPLQCSTRKALPVLDTPVVDLGDVTVGDSCSALLKLHNDGFIPSDVTITPASAEDGDAAAAAGGGSDFDFKPSAHLASYGHCGVKFSFTAHAGRTRAERDSCVGVRSMLVQVRCSAAPQLQMQALVKANVVQEPLALAEETIDIGVCPVGKAYRCDVQAVNRGLVSLKAVLKLPPSLVAAGIVESQPALAYVQADPASDAGGSFKYSVVFTPPASLEEWQQPALRRFVAGGGERGDGTLSVHVPFQINAPDQTLPVFGTISAELTAGSVQVLAEQLTFNDVPVGLAHSSSLRLRNPSALPVHVGVTKAPPCISFGASAGILVLLPGESKTLPVVCAPQDERPVHGVVHLESTLGDTHTLPVHVLPVVPALSLSSSLVTFPSLSAQQSTSCVLYVRNTSRQPQDVQLLCPPAATGFSVAPHTKANLQCGDQLAVQVDFSPAAFQDGAVPPVAADGGDAALLSSGGFLHKGDVHVAPAGLLGTDGASDKRYSTAFLLACARPSGSAAGAGDSAPVAGAMLQAAVLPETLSLSQQNLDFGTVAVSSTTTLYVTVQNHRDTAVGLIVQGLDGSGAFQLASVPPTVQANARARIAVQFSPKAHQTFVSQFYVRAAEGGAPCCLRLRGVGHSPRLRCTPADGRVRFGHVLTHVHHRQFLTVSNDSLFPVAFSFNQQVRGSTEHFGAGMRFSIEPERGELQAGGSMQFAVGFFAEEPTPRVVGSVFTLAVVDQPDAALQFDVSACAWGTPLFAFTGDEPASTAGSMSCQAHAQEQTSFSVGCVNRAFEVPAPAAAGSTKAEAVLELPEQAAGVRCAHTAVALDEGRVEPFWLQSETGGESGATAERDGSIQLKQRVTVRGTLKLQLKACAQLPTGVVGDQVTSLPVHIQTTAAL